MGLRPSYSFPDMAPQYTCVAMPVLLSGFLSPQAAPATHAVSAVMIQKRGTIFPQYMPGRDDPSPQRGVQTLGMVGE